VTKPRSRSGTIKNIAVPIAICFLALVFWPGCVPIPGSDPQPGIVSVYDFSSSADGCDVPCSVYLPNGYDPNRTYPLWVELHALYGVPLLDNNPFNPFSAEMRGIADTRGWIIIAPWGRNLHSLYADGISRNQAPYYEPEIYDDFSNGSISWQPISGNWAAAGGVYRQSNSSALWKESECIGSTGVDYALRVKVKDLSPSGSESAVGVNLRRQDGSGDCYHMDLHKDSAGKKSIRLMKKAAGAWQPLFEMPYDWQPHNPLDGWINIKFSCYEDYLEIYINDSIVNLHEFEYDATPYGYGMDDPGSPLPAGEVSLCSYGGVHEFDEVRIQNEYQYGESDVIDCVLGSMEKYRIDPGRIYLTGHSQGALGVYIAALHNPDLFAASRPADGFSDLYYDYQWLETYYPRDPDPPYAGVNDGRLTEYMRTLVGGEPLQGYPERIGVLNSNSAHYILENAVNHKFRIVHGTPDAHAPNTYDEVEICWWTPYWWLGWAMFPAPEPYNPATSAYRNGKDIADLLQSWSLGDKYYCEYVTDSNIGHGFFESYTTTADFLQGKVLKQRPDEVAYKTYNDRNIGAWWLRLEIPNPGMDEPGMARVVVDEPSNRAYVHARNLSRLALDLDWMGLDCGAGKTMTFNLDDDTSPNVFPIADTTGSLDLELVGAWTDPSAYQLTLDGAPLSQGVHYTIDGLLLVLPDLSTPGGHVLVVEVPSSLPANMVPNPDVENVVFGGFPANWTGEVYNGGTAQFLWDDLEAHDGGRSLRIKDADLTGANAVAHWRSDAMVVTATEEYLLGAHTKARLLNRAEVKLGIAWYDSSDSLIGVDWSDTLNQPEETCNDNWTPLSVRATAPPGSSSARIIAGVVGTSPVQTAGSAWFDDFSFTPR
jgi:hypothetical protein